MLRITTTHDRPGETTLRVEGRLVTDWAIELERVCHDALQSGSIVQIDFADVRSVDRAGIQMLKRIACERIRIINCPPLVGALLTCDVVRDRADRSGEFRSFSSD
jgi:ABC-type transporter Mla MlaB component